MASDAMERITVILFGDRSVDTNTYLQDVLAASRQSSLVASFLDQTNAALSKDISRLSRRHQDAVSFFTSVQELAPALAAGAVDSNVLSSVLLTIAQFVHYIGHTEEYSDPNHKRSETYLAGYCTGQLSAAAVSCADTLSDLISLAVAAVRITLRLELLVHDGACTLSPHGRNGESWSTAVRGMSQADVQSAIDQYHSNESIPCTNQVYIAAVSSKSITISGPPSTLGAIFQDSQSLKSCSRFPFPVCGPYHAAHIFKEADVSTIIDDVLGDDPEEFGSRPRVLPILCTNTGKPIEANNYSGVLREVLLDILRRPMELEHVIQYLVARVREADVQSCEIISIGTSIGGNGVASAMGSETDVKLTVLDISTWWSDKKKDEYTSRTKSKQPGVAIVGYAGRFPGADDADALWGVLEQGLDLHKVIPTDRFDPSTHVDPSGKRRNTSHTPYGCFINDPGHFDPAAFNMSPREAEQTDPMHRLFLVTAYEALEMSGYSANRTRSTRADRVGTICGQTSDDYREVNAGHHVGTYFTTGTIRAFAPGRINYFFKFSGPSYNVDTACSSSLAAIQVACSSIWRGEADTFVAGGVSVLTAPDQYAGLSRGQFLSKTGSCKTFDNSADGYCRGEAVATVILKRLDLAVADKDNIYGVIRAAGTNHSAEAVSITHPHAATQELLYRKIAAQAEIDPMDIDYVEMHGTGTQAGDGIEMTSVSNVFAPGSLRKELDRPLHVGAVKANVGHGEAASGVTALVKSLLMLRRNAIPKHVGIKGTLNENFPDLDERNIRIAYETTPFKSHNGTERRMIVNNFSAAGGNTTLLLEEHFATKPSSNDPRKTHVVTVSGRTTKSLQKTAEGLVAYIDKHRDVSLPSLSYTTTARRMHRPLRRAFVADNLDQIKKMLKGSIIDDDVSRAGSDHTVAFAFTGQGALYTSLGKDLFETSTSFKSDIISFNNIAEQQGFSSFIPLLDGSCDDPKNLSPVQQQLGQVCVQMALARLWHLWGISPGILIGHSLGEYAALQIAGILSISDAIFLVASRASLLEKHCTPWTHKMLAVKTSIASVQDSLDAEGLKYEVACINAPALTVLSGPSEDMDLAAEHLGKKRIKCTTLEVPYAFHSTQVEAILQDFEEIAAKVTFHPAEVALVSPTLGAIIDEGETVDAKYLCRHAREPVDFKAGLECASSAGKFENPTTWVEIGPHPLCLPMIRGTLATTNLSLPSLQKDEAPWKTLANSLAALHCAGLPVDWSEYHREFDDAHELLELPAPVWENETYWLQYKNDWTLLKGDIEEEGSLTANMRWKPTTSVHKILEEEYQDNSAKVTFESDMHDPSLRSIVLGHLVNGAGLCPSSIFADMAMTAADYIHRRLRPETDTLMDVTEMAVSKPVIVSTADDNNLQPLPLKIIAESNMSEDEIKFKFKTGKGKAETLHATCSVFFSDGAKWSKTLVRTSYLIESRMKELEKGLLEGTSQKFLRGMVYKLFSALVTYGDKFRGMQEVVFGAEGYEASAKIQFATTPDDGNFFCSPYWIDGIAHLSGFVLNADEATDSAKHVYISHGWESMRFLKPIKREQTYRSYIKMHPETDSKMMIGDLYLFDNEGAMGFIGGITFQQIPRKQLDLLLPPPGKKSASPPPRRQPRSEPEGRGAKQSPPPQKFREFAAPEGEAPSSKSPVKQALEIIAAETGVDESDLDDSKEFGELGVDSLLSLTILDGLRENGLDLPSTVFTDCPTIGALRQYLEEQESSNAPQPQPSPLSSKSSASSVPTVFDDQADSSGELTPATSVSGEQEASTEGRGVANILATLRAIISEEMGIPEDELSDGIDLASLGLDSLMSLSVLGKLKEETGLDAQPDLLEGEPTLGDVESRLGALICRTAPGRKSGTASPRTREQSRRASATPTPKAAQTQSDSNKTPRGQSPVTKETTEQNGSERRASTRELASATDAAQSSNSQHPAAASSSSAEAASPPRAPPARTASSHLLQGSRSCKQTLFLLPDGSGSATSYGALHNISPSLAVYGLNCPYLRDPAAYTCGIPGVAEQYLAEVRRRQPRGPYTLGGWSAGGVIAFEMARQLLAAGETVARLILIDAPCPLALPALPPSLVRFFADAGIFSGPGGAAGGAPPPDWLLAHFDASVANLRAYEPAPLPQGCAPPATTAIWARDGVCGASYDGPPPPSGPHDVNAASAWMLEDRADFGGNGWEKLVGGGARLQGYSVAGNHFTMMREPNVGGLAQLIREATCA